MREAQRDGSATEQLRRDPRAYLTARGFDLPTTATITVVATDDLKRQLDTKTGRRQFLDAMTQAAKATVKVHSSTFGTRCNYYTLT